MVAVPARRVVTLGVEEEFLLVGADDGLPVDGCADVLDADRSLRGPADARDGRRDLQRELLSSMVETASDVCTDLAQLRAELTASRARLARAARKAGCARSPPVRPRWPRRPGRSARPRTTGRWRASTDI
ncbi:hypothetical protein GCM10023237_06320 [Streptomyces coeruleoprunus]